MSLPTPNYIITKNYTVTENIWVEKILEAGSFVRPIQPNWLPNHVKETWEFRNFDTDTEVFVYCKYGIVKIAIDVMRRV